MFRGYDKDVFIFNAPYMAGESVLRSVVPIDICRVKDEICARNARDTNETKRVGGYGDEKTRESDGNRCVWKKKTAGKRVKIDVYHGN